MFKDDILSIVIFDPIRVFVFFGENDCTILKTGSRFLKTTPNATGVLDLKGISINVGVVVDGAVLVAAHNPGSFTYATVFLLGRASSPSTQLWKP